MLYVVKPLVDTAHSFIHSFDMHSLPGDYGPGSVLSLYEIYTTSVQLGKQLQFTVEVFHWWKSDQACPGRAGAAS